MLCVAVVLVVVYGCRSGAGPALADAMDQMKRLYNLFIACDATQVEINPLVIASDGKSTSFH